MRKIFLFACVAGCLLSLKTNARSFTINGMVTDSETKEILIGANISHGELSLGASTNSYGFYSLKLPEGSVKLSCSCMGYEPVVLDLELRNDTTIHIRLSPKTFQTPNVVITATRNERSERGLGTTVVPLSIIKNTPAFFGESDLMKSLQYLPGVQNSAEGKSDLTIRGGSPDQNLILLDGIPVYNADHAFGFLSIFNTEALKNVTLFKSGFPSRFGGRLSSVIDINTKDGNKETIRGSATLGLLAANINIEGPVAKDKTSFFFSARRSVVDLYLLAFRNQLNGDDTENDRTNFNFYDINAKIHHKIGDRTSFYVMAYHGGDKLMNENSDEGIPENGVSNSISRQDWQWGNTICAMRLNRSIASNMFLNATLAYNSYRYQTTIENSYVREGTKVANALDYSSGIKDYSVSLDYEYAPSNAHLLRSGLRWIIHDFRPEVLTPRSYGNEESTPDVLPFQDIRANEFAFYAEDEWNMTKKMRMNMGFRLSTFSVKGISYNAFDPRFSIRYFLMKNLSVVVDYTHMEQYIHLLSNNSLLLQTDLWVPATGSVKPMRSRQFSLGFNTTIAGQLAFSVSGYHKNMDHVVEYKDGASFASSSSGWENKVESGIGRSYGIEFALEKNIGKTSGSFSYALSKTERKFEDINNGEWFPARYDRRHQINAAIMHKISSKVDIMLNWAYTSGNMMTIPIMTVVTPDIPYYPAHLENELTQLEHRNNYRMPVFHRLDVGMNYTPKKRKSRYGIWNFSIYNVYNRMNSFKLFIETDMNRNSNGEPVYTKKLRQVSLFPFMPSVSYNYRF